MSRLQFPIKQGSLDGLCGIYTVLNSLEGMFGSELRPKLIKTSFSKICRFLLAHERLHDALISGMSTKVYKRVIGEACQHFASQNLYFSFERGFKDNKVEASNFWKTLENHLSRHGPGSIIIGLSGKHDHWTSLKTIDDKRLMFLDSSGLKYLDKSRCSPNTQANSLHVLLPKEVFLLKKAKVNSGGKR